MLCALSVHETGDKSTRAMYAANWVCASSGRHRTGLYYIRMSQLTSWTR